MFVFAGDGDVDAGEGGAGGGDAGLAIEAVGEDFVHPTGVGDGAVEIEFRYAGEFLALGVFVEIDFEGLLFFAAGLHVGAVAFVADGDVCEFLAVEIEVGVDVFKIDAGHAGDAVAFAFGGDQALCAAWASAHHHAAHGGFKERLAAGAEFIGAEGAGFLCVPTGEPGVGEGGEFGGGELFVAVGVAFHEGGGEDVADAEATWATWAAGTAGASGSARASHAEGHAAALGFDGGPLGGGEQEMDGPDLVGLEQLRGLLWRGGEEGERADENASGPVHSPYCRRVVTGMLQLRSCGG